MRRLVLIVALIATSAVGRSTHAQAETGIFVRPAPPTDANAGNVGSELRAKFKAPPRNGGNTGNSGKKTKGKTKPGTPAVKRTTKKGRRFQSGPPPKTCVAKPGNVADSIQTTWTCSPTGRLTRQQCSQTTCVTTVITRPPTPAGATPENNTPPPAVIPQPDIPWLIENATKQLPPPQPVMSPPFHNRPQAEGVAGLPVYFAVDTDQWRPFSVTATDGYYHLTITATPTKLTFDSGLNNETQTCDGPGERITKQNYERAAKTECKYTYQQSTREGKDFDATLAITWTTSVITDIEPADLVTNNVAAEITTTTNISVPIVEIQAVLQPPT
jgi:hypothetical protein